MSQYKAVFFFLNHGTINANCVTFFFTIVKQSDEVLGGYRVIMIFKFVEKREWGREGGGGVKVLSFGTEFSIIYL